MPAIVRPERAFSFADHAKHPRAPFPGDRLDAQIQNLIDAIHSTQLALAEIRRDDGGLKNQSVGPDQLAPKVGTMLADAVQEATRINAVRAEQGAAVTRAAERTAQLFAVDAESAAISAAQFLSAVNAAKQAVDQSNHHISALSSAVSNDATDAENWGNYSQAQAENAIAAKDEALQWAEYLAGPVVNSNDAPAYIADSAFPHGLYYQPVQGYGGVAGLWSAKWWAVYAAQLVGPWSFYYLGAWPEPPMPGSSNPSTGIKVPNPLAPGSFYYDTTTGQLYIWDGSQWKTPYALTAGYQSHYVYVATAGQKIFSGADANGQTPAVGTSPSDVHLNGIKLVPTVDYTISGNALTLTISAPINSIVQWDLLVPTSQLAPGAVNAFKTTISPVPDGTIRNFTMTYPNPGSGTQPVNATNNAQLLVSLDGVVQEPGVDFTVAGSNLTLATAPLAGSHFWAVWLANAVLVP